MATLSFSQLPFEFSRSNRLQIISLRHFLGQIKLNFCNFYEPFLRMGFTNIDVNHNWGLLPRFRFYNFHFRFEMYVISDEFY